MGQKPSILGGKFNAKLPLSLVLKRDQTHNPNPEQPIKFQYKTRRKKGAKNTTTNGGAGSFFSEEPKFGGGTNRNSSNRSQSNSNSRNTNEVKCRIIKTQNAPIRTKSEPTLVGEKIKEKHRHGRSRKNTTNRIRNETKIQQFGYEIEDVDAFLSKATIEKPANIPVVLAFPSVLYQTRIGGYQAEISLPLGMVVNAVFKNQHWLYVQTPHAEEGYVSYAACLPLGIIPPDDDTPAPCWEKSTDVFPKPSGNMTDTEKLSSKSECSGSRCRSRQSRNAASTCGERSVDRLYLRAAASAKNKGTRQTLLVISCDFNSTDRNVLSVQKGDVVSLLSAHLEGWFWVRNKEGFEGFIPAAIAGHGFL